MSNHPLPEDILLQILMSLPVKSLLRFKSVSKSWYSLISHHNFTVSHFNRSIKHRKILIKPSKDRVISLDLDSNLVEDLQFPDFRGFSNVLLVGSCNGLVCMVYGVFNIVLWNPSTRWSLFLPKPRFKYEDGISRIGFGFDSSSEDYKVVRLSDGKPSETTVEVYSLKTKSWKMFESRSLERPSCCTKSLPGVLVSGAFHWVDEQLFLDEGLFFDERSSRVVIVAFDVAEEGFKEIPVPEFACIDDIHVELGVLGEWLCLRVYRGFADFEIWVMKQYGVKDSWEKLASICFGSGRSPYPEFTSREVLCFSKDGDEIVMHITWSKLVRYNLREETFSEPIWISDDEYIPKLITYVESFVCLNQ